LIFCPAPLPSKMEAKMVPGFVSPISPIRTTSLRPYEERALHGMSGTLLIDSRSWRLHQLSGRLDDDVTYGYGMLGTIRRGSNFTTTRDMVAHDVWKTTFLDTHIDGRIAILKTISCTQHSIHQEFCPLPLGHHASSGRCASYEMKKMRRSIHFQHYRPLFPCG
jgi:hypothetical protein